MESDKKRGGGISWCDLRARVREIRREFGAHIMPLPSTFTFRQLSSDNENILRLYFLSSQDPGRESTIFFCDLPSSSASSAAHSCLQWTPVIESPSHVVPKDHKVSKEELLLLERKRCMSSGITTYDVNDAKFIFPIGGSIYQCIDSQKSVMVHNSSLSRKTVVVNLKSKLPYTRLNATMCPSNSDWIAFAANGNIWLTNSNNEEEVQLTFQKNRLLTNDCSSGSSSVTSGLPSYVMQEEFNRFAGFWWCPTAIKGKYRILYEEVDESLVDKIKFPTANNDVEEFRFPKAGTLNATSTIKMLELGLDDSNNSVEYVKECHFQADMTTLFPWQEYVVRMGWTPDSNYVWVYLLDRAQQRLELVVISAEAFVETAVASSQMDERCYPGLQVIFSEWSESWINVSDILVFYTDNTPGRIQFIVSSEETGFRHLYKVTAKINIPNQDTSKEGFLQYCQRPDIVEKTAITCGAWSVADKQIWLDETRDLVYFHGMMDSPLERHLYVVSLKQPGHIRRLTALGYTHNVQLSTETSTFVTVYSSLQCQHSCQVFRLNYADLTIEGIRLEPIGCLLEPKGSNPCCPPPELVCQKLSSSNDDVYGLIFKPHELKEGQKYPVVLSVYGGPEVQLVTNSYKGVRHLRNHLLAAMGYCVVSIDSRGSYNRGKVFESHLYHRLGQVELSDQVEVLQCIAAENNYMDTDRIAIHGWSYGGYLALKALTQYPKIFKVSVAGAPVTDWSLYDTGYTERYMGQPSSNAPGYRLGSILNYVSDLPDEPNRLLIVHGVMDENVHFFFHTLQLLSLMIRFGKPYQLQIYPNERHSLRHIDASEHYETSLLSFLQSNL